MRLLLFHPELPSCDECKKWMVNRDWSFTTRKNNEGDKVRVPNPPWRPGITPCSRCPKIPDDAKRKEPDSAQELNEKNWMAYNHYLECKVTGDWPDDWIVKYHAALIRSVEDAYQREPLLKLTSLISALIIAPK